MRHETAFEVDAAPARVAAAFADLPTLARSLPGATIGQAEEDGTHPGTLVVSFGPKKIAFKGRVSQAAGADARSGTVSGTASADVRGARMAVTMGYRLLESVERPGGTRVALELEAELTGLLAEFAKTGGVVLVEAVLKDFAARLGARFAAEAAEAAEAGRQASDAPTAAVGEPGRAAGAAPPTTSEGATVAPAAGPAHAAPARPLDGAAPPPAGAPTGRPGSPPIAASPAAPTGARQAPPPFPPDAPDAPATLSAGSLAGGVLRALGAALGRAVARAWRAIAGPRRS